MNTYAKQVYNGSHATDVIVLMSKNFVVCIFEFIFERNVGFALLLIVQLHKLAGWQTGGFDPL